MTARSIALAVAVLAVALSGCDRIRGETSGATPPAALNSDKLEVDIDQKMGGVGTCVIIADTASGHELYRYNAPACRVPLPPCLTFAIPEALAGLDLGVITPQTELKWDGARQPTHEWEADADIAKAWRQQTLWWWQNLSGQIGHDRMEQALTRYGYGNRNVDGAPTTFWMGPQSGGALTLTTEDQLAFVRRFYTGALPVKPDTATFVQGLTVDETRTDAAGPSVVSGQAASCASVADGSRGVAWWVGRLKTPTRDVVFAASLESANAPPGLEIERDLKAIFADVGLWPAAAAN
jgi:beta-lactamase class D